MTPALRSALTLTVLVLLLVVATLWGWRALTQPLPQVAETPVCVETEVAAGEEVVTNQVAVSVFNASRRNGLATKTMNQLVGRGFVSAGTGNAPADTDVTNVRIHARNAKDPAVALVLAQFRGAEVVPGPSLGLGVVVVVGDDFSSLRGRKKAPTSVTAEAPASICTPPDLAS